MSAYRHVTPMLSPFFQRISVGSREEVRGPWGEMGTRILESSISNQQVMSAGPCCIFIL